MALDPVLETLLSLAGPDSVVVVHSALVHFTGSLEAGMMLNQLLYHRSPSRDGWIAKSEPEWMAEIHHGKHKVRSARESLETLGVLETEIRHVERSKTMHYRVNQQSLDRAWREWVQQGRPNRCSTKGDGGQSNPEPFDVDGPKLISRNQPMESSSAEIGRCDEPKSADETPAHQPKSADDTSRNQPVSSAEIGLSPCKEENLENLETLPAAEAAPRRDEMWEAWVEVTRKDPSTYGRTKFGGCIQNVKLSEKLTPTPELMIEFLDWWRKFDYRGIGSKTVPPRRPKPHEIPAEWGNFADYWLERNRPPELEVPAVPEGGIVVPFEEERFVVNRARGFLLDLKRSTERQSGTLTRGDARRELEAFLAESNYAPETIARVCAVALESTNGNH